jgi:NitT/TauT family transport system ATP-binding protein
MQIRTQTINHTFQPRNGGPLNVLKDINIEIHSGDFVALIGESGCGKSTLLRILGGLLSPSHGNAQLAGNLAIEALTTKRVGWLAQNPALLPWKNVRENISLAQKINPQTDRNALSPDELLDLVNLSEFAQAYPLTLSGGMQQRVALARTLALGADVWLMDEPFAALDELTREALTAELLSLWQRFHPTVVWVTHHIYEAVRLSNRVLVMTPRPGRIACDINIPIAHPRDDSQPEFQEIVTTLRGKLSTYSAQKPTTII